VYKTPLAMLGYRDRRVVPPGPSIDTGAVKSRATHAVATAGQLPARPISIVDLRWSSQSEPLYVIIVSAPIASRTGTKVIPRTI
jgi:hypothetical protein